MSWCCAACFEHWDKFLNIQNKGGKTKRVNMWSA